MKNDNDLKELTEEEFTNQMHEFQNESSQEILEIIKNFSLPVMVFGLTSIVRVLIDQYGNDDLKEVAVNYLTLKDFDVINPEDADNIIKEEE